MPLSDTPLSPPSTDLDETSTYVISPRPKRVFHTVLDASELFAPGRQYTATVHTRFGPSPSGDRLLTLSTTQQLTQGTMHETLECTASPTLTASPRLLCTSILRTFTSASGAELRRESARFSQGALPMPRDLYPETCLPFLLRFSQDSKQRHSVHAWISDRMVARVYFEPEGTATVTVPAGRFEVSLVRMYPDLNDWVKMPKMLAELSKPFLPKYHMAYELRPPHRLVRFEGSYGPPGAPELVLELLHD